MGICHSPLSAQGSLRPPAQRLQGRGCLCWPCLRCLDHWCRQDHLTILRRVDRLGLSSLFAGAAARQATPQTTTAPSQHFAASAHRISHKKVPPYAPACFIVAGRRGVCPLRLSARSCEKAALLARMFLASSSLQSPYGRGGPSVSTGATFHPSTPPASGSSCICILSGADLPPLYSCSRIRIHRCSATVRRRGAGHLTALSVHVKHFSSTCMHICIISK